MKCCFNSRSSLGRSRSHWSINEGMRIEMMWQMSQFSWCAWGTFEAFPGLELAGWNYEREHPCECPFWREPLGLPWSCRVTACLEPCWSLGWVSRRKKPEMKSEVLLDTFKDQAFPHGKDRKMYFGEAKPHPIFLKWTASELEWSHTWSPEDFQAHPEVSYFSHLVVKSILRFLKAEYVKLVERRCCGVLSGDTRFVCYGTRPKKEKWRPWEQVISVL